MKRLLAVTTVLATSALWASAPANASVVPYDPLDPQLFVQQSGNSPAGGDPNLLVTGATNPFVVGVAGNHILDVPLLVIIALYNGVGTPVLGCDSNCASVTPASLGTYGLTAQTVVGFNSGIVYDALGLAAGNSLSFDPNLKAADVAIGLAEPASFTLEVFAINGVVSQNNPVGLTLTGAPKGSFIAGYSCEGALVNGECDGNGNIGQSVMTNAGLVDDGVTPPPPPPPPIPEPASIALLGMGLLGIGAVTARRRR